MGVLKEKDKSTSKLIDASPAVTEEQESVGDADHPESKDDQEEVLCEKAPPLNDASVEEETPDETPVTSEKEHDISTNKEHVDKHDDEDEVANVKEN